MDVSTHAHTQHVDLKSLFLSFLEKEGRLKIGRKNALKYGYAYLTSFL
jgi:hypothetical protein